jgi:hypothetical protein
MTYRGQVTNGVVVLNEPVELPEGTAVVVTPVDELVPSASEEERMPTLYERLKDVIGTVEGPPDLAENHDHYLYGVPKKK